jgi:ABC-type sugar transport system ATPase subunit
MLGPTTMPNTRSALLLETRGLTKVLGSLPANDGVDLPVRAGEVLGENGAGKSTSMKMLYGYYQPTAGEIVVGGEVVRLKSPRQGRSHGIGMVFQSVTLIPAMEVWENIARFLDHEKLRLWAERHRRDEGQDRGGRGRHHVGQAQNITGPVKDNAGDVVIKAGEVGGVELLDTTKWVIESVIGQAK